MTAGDVYERVSGVWVLRTTLSATPGGVPLVTALPSSPVDGQEIYLQTAAMATAGVIWHLRYNASSSSPYKWECVGGPPLTTEVEIGGTGGSTSSGTYGNLTGGTTTGPDVVVPCAGVYDVQVEYMWQNNTASAWTMMSYTLPDGTAASDLRSPRPQTNVVNLYLTSSAKRRVTTTTAGTFASKYRVTAGTGIYIDRVMTVWPVRLG